MTTTIIISKILFVVSLWVIAVVADYLNNLDNRGLKLKRSQNILYIFKQPTLRSWIYKIDLGFTPWIVYHDGLTYDQCITLKS